MPFQPPSGSLGRNVLDVGARLAPTVFLGVVLHLGGVCAEDVPSPLLLSIPGVKTLRVTIPSCYCSKNLPGWREGVFYHPGSVPAIPLVQRGAAPQGEVRALVPNLPATGRGSGGVPRMQPHALAALQLPLLAETQIGDF